MSAADQGIAGDTPAATVVPNGRAEDGRLGEPILSVKRETAERGRGRCAGESTQQMKMRRAVPCRARLS